MFGYIPARGGSKRVPRKNIRLLAGKPIILRTIENLSRVSGLEGIGVSTDDDEIQSLVEHQGIASVLGKRSAHLSNDQATFMDLVREDLPRYAGHFGSYEALFVLPTAVLVTPQEYERAKAVYSGGQFGLVISTVRFEKNPYRALVEGAQGIEALFPEEFLKPTQDLPVACTDAGCFYLFNSQNAAPCQRLLDLKPVKGVELAAGIGIDVDTEADWQRMEAQFAAQ